MRLKLLILLAVAALAGPLAAHATTPSATPPSLPTSAQDRSVDPVVLTGNQFPSWSAGPELVNRKSTIELLVSFNPIVTRSWSSRAAQLSALSLVMQ